MEFQVLFVPVAGDLCTLVCAMRFSSPLERVGGEASGIAKKALILMKLDEIRGLRILESAYLGIRRLMSSIITSYLSHDRGKTSGHLAECTRLEESLGTISDRMMEFAGKQPERIAEFAQAVLIARSLTNIVGALRRMASDVMALSDQ